MCGIAGGVGIKSGSLPQRTRVARMTKLVSHRGPDAQGDWRSASGRAVFGHRRLAVIDVDGGLQPMVDPSGRFCLIFNGEIYNYKELRSALVAEGVAFRTNSDTEVLLHLLARKWTAALADLTGMYALAIWDDEREELLLARDRIGEKPLYYSADGDVLYFASTFEALRRTQSDALTVDPGAVDDYLTLGYIPAPRTVSHGIGKLPAGTLLRVSREGIEQERYWRVSDFPLAYAGTYVQAVDELDHLLSESVRLRLRSDVPLGVFLSGGVDSSLVTAYAVRHTAEPVRTFTIGFDEAGYDESTVAEAVALALGTKHETFRARYQLMELLPRAVRHFGEPFGEASALALWLLAERTRAHVTVALGGDGGDEGFGGYHWYRNAGRLRRVRAVLGQPLAAAAHRVVHRFEHGSARLARVGRGLRVVSGSEAAIFARVRSYIDDGEALRLYRGALLESRLAGCGGQAALLASYDAAPGSALRRMRVADLETYLADSLMPKVDVATMAHGLEARAPLLDHGLLTFALSLPDAWVDRDGGKRILKDVLYRYLPRALFERPKQGFNVPLKEWFVHGLRPRITELVHNQPLAELGWFDRGRLGSLVAEHFGGVRDHSQRLFGLLILAEWLAQN